MLFVNFISFFFHRKRLISIVFLPFIVRSSFATFELFVFDFSSSNGLLLTFLFCLDYIFFLFFITLFTSHFVFYELLSNAIQKPNHFLLPLTTCPSPLATTPNEGKPTTNLFEFDRIENTRKEESFYSDSFKSSFRFLFLFHFQLEIYNKKLQNLHSFFIFIFTFLLFYNFFFNLLSFYIFFFFLLEFDFVFFIFNLNKNVKNTLNR